MVRLVLQVRQQGLALERLALRARRMVQE